MTPAARGARRRWRPGVVAWALWALAILGLAPIAWFDHILIQAGRSDLTQLLPLLPHVVAGVGTATVGALLASRRPVTRSAGSCFFSAWPPRSAGWSEGTRSPWW